MFARGNKDEDDIKPGGVFADDGDSKDGGGVENDESHRCEDGIMD